MREFEWWEAKRRWILADRGLDFRDAEALFTESRLFTYAPPRGGEARWVSVGYLGGRLVTVVWTPREEAIRIISMRRAHRAEARRFGLLYG